MRHIQFFPIASHFGAGTRGSAFGPMALIQSLPPSPFIHTSSPMIPDDVDTFSDPYGKDIGRIGRFIETQILPNFQTLLQSDHFPLVLSGDHANAMGTLAALGRENPDKTIGVLWIDAHCDIHTPFTTPSGNLHGMTLCTALNTDNLPHQINTPSKKAIEKWQQLKALSGKTTLKPEHLIFMGLRSLEPPEKALIEAHNITVFDVENTRQQGIKAVMEQVAEQFANVDILYVSFDVDSLDITLMPATGTPEPQGYTVDEVKQILDYALDLPALRAFEITEFNPLFDDENHTCQQRVLSILQFALRKIQHT
ncbi:hypothetical protein A4G19_01030 [Pasteurellaceae bacterium Macca]|nr:hypothetical protein [Pasteurellaceae bacterium Macca]